MSMMALDTCKQARQAKEKVEPEVHRDNPEAETQKTICFSDCASGLSLWNSGSTFSLGCLLKIDRIQLLGLYPRGTAKKAIQF